MIRSSSRISYHNDPLSRAVMRGLLLLQPGAMVIVIGLCLLDRFVLALAISFLTLFLFPAVFIWLYARYRTLPVVCEKRILTQLVHKFERNHQAEDLRMYAAIQKRARLVQSEKEEIQTALSMSQKNHIETGLRNASIKHAAILGVGPRLKQRLAGYGIASAADVSDRIAQLPGFGVEKCHTLLGWRSSVAAKLESTKPSALPPEQLEAIQQKHQALQDENNAAEKKAMTSRQILEHELMSLKPRLSGLASITFAGYLSNSLASRGIVAALVAFVLVLTQVISSVSATLAFGMSNAAARMGSVPIASPTITSTSTVTSAPVVTSTSTITVTVTTIPSETSTPANTSTSLPTSTFQPENTPTLAAPPVSSGGGNCDPSYPGVCIPPAPPDLDCDDVPYDNFQALPPDPHNFDREGDGLGCEG